MLVISSPSGTSTEKMSPASVGTLTVPLTTLAPASSDPSGIGAFSSLDSMSPSVAST
jgi:hypothetical protein